MKTVDLVAEATANTQRHRSRTLLTVIALMVGAFTLALTSGVGAGVRGYIDDQVAAAGSPGSMQVTSAGSDGIPEYEEGGTQVEAAFGPGSAQALSDADLTAAAAIPGVISVEKQLPVRADWIGWQGDTRRLSGSLGTIDGDEALMLVAGREPVESGAFEVVLTDDYADGLGVEPAAAIGRIVEFGYPLPDGTNGVVAAEVVGVTEPSLFPMGGPMGNKALVEHVYAAETTGLPASRMPGIAAATLTFDPDSTDEQIQAIRDGLADAGLSGATATDRLGLFATIIDTVVLVLNGFAAIALIAAGFGIVNTLSMAVQERTREIGLSKALGMTSRNVFGLFAVEAAVIGVLGAAAGAGGAVLLGYLVNRELVTGLLADLPGIAVFAVDPLTLLVVVGIVLAIALVAGTIPALRAARRDPIQALRYE